MTDPVNTTPNVAPTAEREHRRRYLVGIALLFAAGLFWSLNGALIKLVYDKGAGPDGVTIACYRSLVAGIFLLPLAVRRRRTPGQSAGRFATLLAPRGTPSVFGLRPAAAACTVFFTLMTATFVIANTLTAAANAIILQYTSTFWIFLLSPWLLEERPHARDLWLLGLAMVGIAVIFAGNARTDLLGLSVALASGLFFGLLTIMIRQMRHCDSAAVTVLNNIGSGLLLIPAVALFAKFGMAPRAWGLVIAMGIVQFGVPYYLYSLGLTRVPAYQAALITLCEPVLVPVWTYLAVGEVPSLQTIAGGAVILIALVLFTLRARRSLLPPQAADGAA